MTLAEWTPSLAPGGTCRTEDNGVAIRPDGLHFDGPSGTFVDTGIRFAGYQSDRGIVQLQVDKAFTCADGSGTFFVKLQIQANFDTGIESFTWVVQGGTANYSALRGSGTGSTAKTSRPAAATWPERKAVSKACSCAMPPRDTLI